MQPGLLSERLISQDDTHNSNQESQRSSTKFLIPSESELRRAKRQARSLSSKVSRHIAFKGDGSEVLTPKELPFKPPGLQWQDQPCLTTSQLQAQTEQRRGQIEKKIN